MSDQHLSPVRKFDPETGTSFDSKAFTVEEVNLTIKSVLDQLADGDYYFTTNEIQRLAEMLTHPAQAAEINPGAWTDDHQKLLNFLPTLYEQKKISEEVYSKTIKFLADRERHPANDGTNQPAPAAV